MTVRTQIIKIGNSRGVRIPKTMLEASGIEGEVTISFVNGGLVVRSILPPRSGWEEQLKEMVASEGDLAVDGCAESRFDEEEWEWV